MFLKAVAMGHGRSKWWAMKNKLACLRPKNLERHVRTDSLIFSRTARLRVA